LDIRVFDRSFNCDKAEEEILITVYAQGEGQIQDFEVSTNGSGERVPLVDGVNLAYRITAVDKGQNKDEANITVDGYLSTQPKIRLISPASQNFVQKWKINPAFPPGMSRGREDIEIRVRIDDVEDYKLIKRVEFSYDGGGKTIVEGATMPTDLEFEDFVIEFDAEDMDEIILANRSKTINYRIRVVDLLNREKIFSGSVSFRWP